MLDTLIYKNGAKCQAVVIKDNNKNGISLNHKII